MTRKAFIKKLGLGAFGLVLGRPMIGNVLMSSFYENGGHYPTIIIGTGYGSAVAAERLATEGHQVLMLEMGIDWDGYKQENPDFEFPVMSSPTKESTWMNDSTQLPIETANANSFDKFTGILRRKDFKNVKIFMGRGIGGGSLVNGGMTVTPNENYFEQIFNDVGVNIPVTEFYQTYFPMANANLGINTVPVDVYNSEWYQFARLGVQEGINAGFTEVDVPNIYDFDYMRTEINGSSPRSATKGEVLFGNNHGKQDLTKTYIKRALDTGNVTIMPQHKVDHIIDKGDGTYALKVLKIDTLDRDICVKEFTCDKLFLGAGSLGTTKLLLKSKDLGTMPNVSIEVGQYWGNNGNTMCSRMTFLPLLHSSRGNNQSTMPVRGLDNFNSPDYPFFAEIAPMPQLGSHTGMYLVVNKLKKTATFNGYGEIIYDPYKNDIRLDWDERHNQHMRSNAEYFLQQMNDSNPGSFGDTYVNNTTLFPNNGVDETICYHPLGGCVLGKATDMYGRLNAHQNLFVMDGALIPGTLGVNPYVTITAIAERNIQNIIANNY